MYQSQKYPISFNTENSVHVVDTDLQLEVCIILKIFDFRIETKRVLSIICVILFWNIWLDL